MTQEVVTREPELVRDETYPEMWRVRRSDGSLSDMANKSRAMDALHAAERKLAKGDDDAVSST